jgi:Fur family ferric uptake transcriptional regulator
MSAEEIGRALGRDAPVQTTIYRTLNTFVEARLVTRRPLADRVNSFEWIEPGARGGPEDHAHFRCTKCGHTECVELPRRLPLPPGLARRQVEEIHVLIRGRCRGCGGGRTSRSQERR